MSQAIIVFYFKEILWSKLKKMVKKPYFGPDLDLLGPIQAANFFYKTNSYTMFQVTILCNLKKN